jgi:hypothetical protein
MGISYERALVVTTLAGHFLPEGVRWAFLRRNRVFFLTNTTDYIKAAERSLKKEPITPKSLYLDP